MNGMRLANTKYCQQRHDQEFPRIPNYQILAELGRGGMGVVYLAEHEVLQREVAIKVMLDQYARDMTLRERFLREARVMATLDHPNIVRIYDLIDMGKNVALVMEFVDGRTLEDMIGREVGPIPHENALPIFTHILDAVSVAHGKGIIHRDLKPANVLVSNDSQVKVTDFGIAKAIGDSKLTRTGTVLGTPIYMAPEQILAKEIDHLVDIYALGMTLYVMLAGRSPFEDEEVSEFLLLKSCLEDPIRDPREYYPYIPENIVLAMHRALAKDKSQRFQACEDFSFALNDSEKQVEIKIKKGEANNYFHLNTKFVKIEQGKFIMGCVDMDRDGKPVEYPQHDIFINNLEIMQTLVTQQLWCELIDKNPSLNLGIDNPVDSVSYHDVERYLYLLNSDSKYYKYRLPTEAEWEYACRAGSSDTRFWWGNHYRALKDFAWYDENSDNQSHPVAQKTQNPWQLYDMLGNVWEWCADWYDPDYYSISNRENPTGPTSGTQKVLRGGSYFSKEQFCRPSSRRAKDPGTKHHLFGFRLVRELKA